MLMGLVGMVTSLVDPFPQCMTFHDLSSQLESSCLSYQYDGSSLKTTELEAYQKLRDETWGTHESSAYLIVRAPPPFP